ncbi:MAG: hypothetical protein ACPG32_12215, partial [Akkermansiaceae bacterium]
MKAPTYLIGLAFAASITTLPADPLNDDPFGDEPAAERNTHKNSNKKRSITLRHIRTQVEFIEMPLDSMV